MQQTINLLFSNGTIEDERDALVLGTLYKLICANVPMFDRNGGVRLYDYCLGVSIDAIHEALPKTGGVPACPRPALTIYELIASIERLQWRQFIGNDGFQVLHLKDELINAIARELFGEDDEQVTIVELLAGTFVTLADRESRIRSLFPPVAA